MLTHTFLQHYWWAIISLLAGLLSFLLFVQGANSLLFSAAKSEHEFKLIMNSTGRKWELTFTTLVTFGGAFFASFPLFYSTSFGGAYWIWMALLLSFVVQAVSYEYQSKSGNIVGTKAFRMALTISGIVAPLLIGTAVSTFFFGAPFTVNKEAMTTQFAPVISSWDSPWRGLEALWSPAFNLVLGLAMVLLSRSLGALYLLNNVSHAPLHQRLRRQLMTNGIAFVIIFVAYLAIILTKEGYHVDSATQMVSLVSFKYLSNLLDMPVVLALLLMGIALVLFGIFRTLICKTYKGGIWFAGAGTVVTVMSLFLVLGWNDTAYYPSTSDLQSSLTLSNSCSSHFTLQTMAYVSLIIPFVLAYIAYCWRKMDKTPLTAEEMDENPHLY